jgi:hypothetical protein
MFTPLLPVPQPENASENHPEQKDFIGLSFFTHEDGGLRLYGHGGDQNGFISHLYFDPSSKKGYLVSFNTDATGAEKNTHRFDDQLRDYLVGAFFPHSK